MADNVENNNKPATRRSTVNQHQTNNKQTNNQETNNKQQQTSSKVNNKARITNQLAATNNNKAKCQQ